MDSKISWWLPSASSDDMLCKQHWWKMTFFHLRSLKSATETSVSFQIKNCSSLQRQSTVTWACNSKHLVENRASFPEKRPVFLSHPGKAGERASLPGACVVTSASFPLSPLYGHYQATRLEVYNWAKPRAEWAQFSQTGGKSSAQIQCPCHLTRHFLLEPSISTTYFP